MKLHYKGKFNLDPESLPCKPHKEGAVRFKEAKDSKEMMKIATVISIVLFFVFDVVLYLRYDTAIMDDLLIGCVFSLLCAFPHELLHAVCFKEDVYLYTNLKHGMLFVVGPETMSKGRFIFMSLLPNLVFGIIPFLLALFFPPLKFLGSFGVVSICMGAGDFYNIFNAATQMPKGARTYLHQFNSYWYMPENKVS